MLSKKRWGWIVVVSSFCNFFAGFGVLFCFGLLNIAMQEEFDSSSSETAWIGSIALGLSSLGTLASSILVQKFGNRRVASVGILLTVTGCISTSFMVHLVPIYFTFGILVGMGLNLVFVSSLNLILRYFLEENASRPISFALAGTTSGMLALNPLVHLMITHWGWRNMLRVMGSVILFIGIPCLATYTQPQQNSINLIQARVITRENIDEEKDSELTQCTKEYTAGQRLPRRQSQVFNKTLKEQLQVLFFPDVWFFAIAILGGSMAMTFYICSFVSFMTKNGIEKKDSATVMTVMAFGEVCGKFFLSAAGNHFPFPKIFLYNFASLLGISVMITLFFAKSLWMVYCLAIVTGLFVMSVYDTVMHYVCVEVFGPERTVETSALLLIANGVGLILGSLFSMSVDSSGSYDAALYAGICIYSLSFGLFTGVPIYQRFFTKDRYIMANFGKDNVK